MDEFDGSAYEEVKTFTGETVWYDPVAHVYRDEDGKKLVSASEYAELLQPEFPLLAIAEKVARKSGIKRDDVVDMWDRNSCISKTFGNALHLSMEQYFKHRAHGTEKKYHLPKPLYLRRAVESFPLKEANIVPEACVSNVSMRMVGRCDGLLLHDEKSLTVVDFKSDAAVEKNLDRHADQLSFYGKILSDKGWLVRSLCIWNYVDEWKSYELKPHDVKFVF